MEHPGHDAGAHDGALGAECGSTPTLLVDYDTTLPDAGYLGVQVPSIASGARDLFYVLNWYAAGPPGSNGQLMAVPMRGGQAVRLAFIPGGGGPGWQPLAVSSETVVFSEALRNDGGTGAIARVPAGGGEVAVLTATNGVARALVADGQNAYFADDDGTKSVPLSGGPARLLTTTSPFTMEIIGPDLYLADDSGGTISSVPAKGGPLKVLENNELGALAPIACGPNLCWLSGGVLGAELKQRAPEGTLTVLATGLDEPHALVFDGKSFFVTVGGGGEVLERIPSTGGTPVGIEGASGMTGLALDDTCLYWSAADGIWSLSRDTADNMTAM